MAQTLREFGALGTVLGHHVELAGGKDFFHTSKPKAVAAHDVCVPPCGPFEGGFRAVWPKTAWTTPHATVELWTQIPDLQGHMSIPKRDRVERGELSPKR